MTQVRGKRIGFIGLGSMGKPMATNILKAGFPLTIYDIRKEPLAEMEKLGAKVANSAKEVGKESDTVVVMARTYPQIKQIITPPEGLLEGMRSGSTLIITSTISPLEIMEIEKITRQHGVEVVDSPVSGGRERAQEGSLVLMAGADMIDRDFEPRGAINTMAKDSRLIMETAVELGTPILISSIPYQVLIMAESRGLGEKDMASIITIFEEYAGIKMSD